jgi:RNA polymerase sigma-70 factor (ECF subfamily)
VAADPADAAADADSLSMAFLLLLERLSPVERAVFLLREVFAYGYGEIAAIVGRSEDNCRQLALRARRHVAAERPRFEVSPRRREELASRFFGALGDGDIDSLVEMLAADAVVYGDGGGTGPSWLRPVTGRDAITRLLRGVSHDVRQLGISIESTEVNGQPGAVLRDPGGKLINVFCLEISDGKVNTIRSVINPGKLRHLGPLADVTELQRRRIQAREPSDKRSRDA